MRLTQVSSKSQELGMAERQPGFFLTCVVVQRKTALLDVTRLDLDGIR